MDTLSYSDKSNGWTSFHSFVPDWMTKLNNRFFSIKDGQVWLHNDQDNPVRNNFYGVQYASKITPVFNDAPSDDKIFKNLVIEGTSPWKATIRTNYTQGEIQSTEFNKRESRWFAHTRKNEDASDYSGAVQGVGVIQSTTGLTITFSAIGPLVSIGDVLHQLNGSTDEVIGTITTINGNVVTVDAFTVAPAPGLFSFSKKDSRIEGAEIRGYFMEVELTNQDTADVELFSVSTNSIKSYV